jgi:hypothetical protein
MSNVTAFYPQGNTVNQAVTASTANFQVPGNANQTSYLFTNVGANTVFFAFGTTTPGSNPAASTVTVSATTGTPLLPNTAQTFSGPANAWVAVIAAATGNTLYVTPGDGL